MQESQNRPRWPLSRASNNCSETVTVNIVPCEERNPPEGETALRCNLVTKMPIEANEDVQRVSETYCLRRQIEVYFRTLKSGCRIEERQFKTIGRVKNCLALLSVLAWRLPVWVDLSIVRRTTLVRRHYGVDCNVHSTCPPQGIFLAQVRKKFARTITVVQRGIARRKSPRNLFNYYPRDAFLSSRSPAMFWRATRWEHRERARAPARAWYSYSYSIVPCDNVLFIPPRLSVLA